MSPEDDYGQWLTDSLDRCLALPARTIGTRSSCQQRVTENDAGASVADAAAPLAAGREPDTLRLTRSESFALRMLEMFTLLSLHARLDIPRAKALPR